jgi:hypothetical protein
LTKAFKSGGDKISAQVRRAFKFGGVDALPGIYEPGINLYGIGIVTIYSVNLFNYSWR